MKTSNKKKIEEVENWIISLIFVFFVYGSWAIYYSDMWWFPKGLKLLLK